MTAGCITVNVQPPQSDSTQNSNCKRLNLPPTMAIWIALHLPDYLPLPFANMNAGTSSSPSIAAMDFDLRRNDLELRRNG